MLFKKINPGKKNFGMKSPGRITWAKSPRKSTVPKVPKKFSAI